MVVERESGEPSRRKSSESISSAGTDTDADAGYGECKEGTDTPEGQPHSEVEEQAQK